MIIKISVFTSLMFFTGNHNSITNISNCCISDFGRCTGSANCNVCTNCSRCAHCNSGGSCGVCSGGSTGMSSSGSSTYRNNIIPSSNSYNTGSLYQNNENTLLNIELIVSSEELKLRAGPGTEFQILETLTLGDILKYLKKENTWIKVYSKNSGTTGYVYYKYVKILD